MPRIAPGILESVVYLYPARADAESGLAAGGTGFFAVTPMGKVFEPPGMPLDEYDEAEDYLYVVTAGHVLRRGHASVIRMNTRLGVDFIELPEEAWIHHPDGSDLAVVPLGRLESQRLPPLGYVSHRLFLTEVEANIAMLAPDGYGPGDECFFVGRFITHEGRIRNRPSVRFGNLSMMHGEPIRDPASGLSHDSFLVEARSLSGYSGSPVFVYSSGRMEADGAVSRYIGPQARFLGIDWCHLHTFEPVLQTDKEVAVEPAQWVRRNTGMAGVLPAWKLTTLLNDDEVVSMRSADSSSSG